MCMNEENSVHAVKCSFVQFGLKIKDKKSPHKLYCIILGVVYLNEEMGDCVWSSKCKIY